jgi:hypothetical protein
MIQGMQASRLVIETKFLEAGKILAQVVEGIASLMTILEEMAKALSPATIAATTQQLQLAAAQLAALPAKQNVRRSTIGQIEDQRAMLASRTEDMRRSLTYMRAFTVSIKITAGGVPDADAEFAVFAQEMCQRVEAGRAEVDALEHGLFMLQGELHTAMQKAETLEGGCAQSIPAVSTQLRDAGGLLGQHRGKMAAATADASTLAQNIRKQVMRMMIALQIGDITRQRVEHIQTGAALLDSIDPALSAPDAARLRALMAALLAAQLDATLLDFDREINQIGTNMEGLSHDAASLLSLRDVAYGQDESGGFLRSLEQRLAEAVGLATEIEQADALAQETGRSAAAAARILSARLDAIQAMKSDVLYMALNTTLKSARLGDAGRPLSIIATELRMHAGYLENIANACVTALRTLIATASDLSSERTEVEDTSAGAALSAVIHGITLAAETTERDVVALSANGDAVLKLLTESRNGLAFRGEIGSALKQAGDGLHGLAAAAQACDGAIEAPATAFFARLGAIYTMAQEREIQAAVAANWGVAIQASPSGAALVETDDFEDVLF